MAESEVTPVDGVAVEINGVEVIAHKGELLIDAAERTGTYISALLLPRAHEASWYVPYVFGRGRHRSRASASAQLHDRVHPWHEGRYRIGSHKESTGRNPRVPARESSARLSRL